MGSTRKDVAKMAGVSEATVSYVINNTKNVTPEVKKRILDAVEALDYHPNLLAKSLVTKETRHVAMMIDNMQNPYYCEMLEGVQHVAEEHGYVVSVISVDYSRKQRILELLSRGVDGLILAVGALDAAAFVSGRIPTVYTGDLIQVDYRKGISDMIGRLAELGHKRIAFLSGMPLDSKGHLRLYNFVDALRENNLPVDRDLFVGGDGNTDEREGVREIDVILERKTDFSAVFAINDLMAIAVMRRLWELGIRVPDDVSVVGCDGITAGIYQTPALTTIDAHAFKTGQALMKSLIAKLHPESQEYKAAWRIEAEFCERETTARAKKKKTIDRT